MEFPYSRQRIIPLDRAKMIGHFAPGIDIPLRPFFGSMGVAPGNGRVDSAPPFAHAGNMDNKELVAGTTLYIPVATKGRCLSPAMDMPDRATARWTLRRWRHS
jgi:acetamidase/formamidase